MIEIIASSLEDAIAIEACGGERIELVSRMDIDGLTPEIELIKQVIEKVKIPVNVMIRFTNKSFEYQRSEIKQMLTTIKELDILDINGLVIGATKDGEVNTELIQEIRSLTDKSITFHRAIDTVDDIELAYRRLYPLVDQILTSGGPGNAIDNMSTLDILYKQSKEKLLIGSGVSLDNIVYLIEMFPKANFHIGSDIRINKRFDLAIDQVRLKQLVKTYKEHLI